MLAFKKGPLLCVVNPKHGIGAVRLFGWGFNWRDTRRSAPLFSERYGYAKRLRFGPLWVGGMKPWSH